MAGAQREAKGPRPAGSDAASARWRWPLWVLVPCASVVILVGESRSQEQSEATPVPPAPSDTAREEVPAPRPSTEAHQPPSTPTMAVAHPRPETVRARLPKHVRSDTGKLASTRLHGDSRIDDVASSPPPDERVVVPIPAKQFEEAGVRLFQRVRVRFWRGFERLAEVGRSDGERPDPTDSTLADPPGRETGPRAAPALIPASQAQPAERLATPAPGFPSEPPTAAPASAPQPGLVTIEADVFDQIRLEIKARLPYFQRCVDAARRRGLPDIRRLQATWLISENGAIKDLRLEGVTDELLATCIMRMGSRPFPVSPGTEVTIPTPIVFVR